MKLRTEMQDGCVHANGYCVDEDAVELRQAEMLVHDAAAANALMQALDERLDYTEKFELEHRASEIMASWGFDSGGGGVMDMRNDLAKARDEWMLSNEGCKCLNGITSGKYLQNRLEMAFIAGWNARERSARRTPEQPT